MSDSKRSKSPRDPAANPLSRRDTLKLASAASALGVGLGVGLLSSDAEAAITLTHNEVGTMTIKLYHPGASNAAQTIDVTKDFVRDPAKDTAVTIKLYNAKSGHESVVFSQEFLVKKK